MSKFPAERLSPLTLGTVQIGIPYGKVVHTQTPGTDTAEAILDATASAGIACIDTAQNYGVAEERIGTWMRRTGAKPLLVSKLPALDVKATPHITSFVEQSCKSSLAQLGVTRLDGYLAHQPADMKVPGFVDALRDCVSSGLVSTYGVSIYTADEFQEAMQLPGIGVIQAPVSVFDMRLVRAGLLVQAAKRGITVFARSVFLQGAVFIDPDKPPRALAAMPTIAQFTGAVRQLRSIAEKAGVPVGALALQTVLSVPAIASTVVGVNAPGELSEIAAWATSKIAAEAIEDAKRIGDDLPAEMIDPRRWPKQT